MKKSNKIIYIIFLIVLTIIGIYNSFTNKNFFKFSLNDLVLLAITFFIGTLFIEKYSSFEKKKEKFENLLNKFEENLFSKDYLNLMLSSGAKSDVLLKIKKLNNILDLLKKHAETFHVSDEINSIAKDYNEYNDKMSAHIDAPSKIDYSELERLKTNIENKCDDIRMKLF